MSEVTSETFVETFPASKSMLAEAVPASAEHVKRLGGHQCVLPSGPYPSRFPRRTTRRSSTRWVTSHACLHRGRQNAPEQARPHPQQYPVGSGGVMPPSPWWRSISTNPLLNHGASECRNPVGAWGAPTLRFGEHEGGVFHPHIRQITQHRPRKLRVGNEGGRKRLAQ